MVQALEQLFLRWNLDSTWASVLAYGINSVLIAGISSLILFLIYLFILKPSLRHVKDGKHHWISILRESKVFHYLFWLVPILILRIYANSFPVYAEQVQKVLFICIEVMILLTLNAIINAVDSLYLTFEISKKKPIKGLLQVMKIILAIVGTILILAEVLDKSPAILLGGLGALTAFLTIVFKDTLLGFVAGVQIATNDIVRIGDWIEMPKYEANGDVIEIALNIVKVRNFDRTITTIPAYALISESFKNWRGMESSGGRRIKRVLYLDINSVSFCTDEMLDSFEHIALIRDYVRSKRQEIAEYNLSIQADAASPVNGRHLTNIGTFRMYIKTYLQQHPGIHQGMTLLVRQLPTEGRGVPLEVYAFTNDTRWVRYEDIQSDIFDHLFAVAPQFGLRIFQELTGFDVRDGSDALIHREN
ncbi:mechanosensitive ion channel family protein [Brucepastera parasyntrophica]|uniref:mechanosensitive ion channel family protein n=1 Tax=Brucepastera parasyntrophica TaxID=2880008 RepID=UPI00210D1BA1|nr:mechanosensitive ion channel family protein [Brucepastera parasyntrophica]ULQ58544.1 mechanosensitive ion channel family protein [Brucepastera parasyntrophica]